MQTYRTADTQIASYLIASGFENYSLEREGNKIFFIFEDNDKKTPFNIFEKEVSEYWSNNTTIEPKKLFNAYKEIKTRIGELLNKNKYG